ADGDWVARGRGLSRVIAFGGVGAAAPGVGVVEGNTIPYLPAALAKKHENAAHWLTQDPEVKCYLPGVPRATYQPYPFQIVQTPATIPVADQVDKPLR